MTLLHQPPPMFWVAGRSGHGPTPDAACPFCGQCFGLHKGIALTDPGAWFPMRAVACVPCGTCEGTRWLGDGYLQPCPACNPEAMP